ncbi:hypothetical protein ABEB36_009091 [Hypothenemus hampei]|uniref:Cilia- and flagella-associated protein 161 n=1 Tax=Hypothenemus hampei TaxID=57062 RepID=A0ABD1EPR3_HYPHA
MIYNDKLDEDRNKTFENRIEYSLPCRLGLWNEDLAIQEDKNTIIAYKRDHCKMIIQKTKEMMCNLLKTSLLAIDKTAVLYGQNYQIRTSDLKKDLKFTDYTNGLFLSGLITEKEIDVCPHFKHGCMLTASSLKDAFVRNTFIITGCNGHSDGQRVLYGEDIMLQISESGGPPLYVQCENLTMETFGNHLSVRLSVLPDFYCRFKVFHWNPQKRIETEGTPLTPDTRIIIQHTASGQNLAVETTSWIPTFFGPECNMSCHTYRDSHKMETAENFWMFGSEPKLHTNLFVRAAKGENIPSDIFE